MVEDELNLNILELIRERINYLESYEDIPTDKENQEVMIDKIPSELIPYLILFICLNFDCINQSYHKRKALLLKSAEYCARKFSQIQNTRNYFFTYCIKKSKIAMTHHGMPTGTQLAQIKNVIKMYVDDVVVNHMVIWI